MLDDAILIGGCAACLLGHGRAPGEPAVAAYDRDRVLGQLAWSYGRQGVLQPAQRAEDRLSSLEALDVEGVPLLLRTPYEQYHGVLPDGAPELDGVPAAGVTVRRGRPQAVYDYRRTLKHLDGDEAYLTAHLLPHITFIWMEHAASL